MKQMFIVSHGGPEKLQLRESPDPSPAGGEIRIRAKPAASTLPTSSRARACTPTRPRFRAWSATKFPARWTP